MQTLLQQVLRTLTSSVCRVLLGIWWFSMTTSAFALSDQALFQRARDAYNSRNETALAQDLAELKKQEYTLAPYADYWLMLLRLDKADNSEVERFLSQYGDYPFAERLRGEWLKILGKQQNWEAFFEHYPHYKREDTAVQCYAMYGRSIAEGLGTELVENIRTLWMTTTDLPSPCNPLFDAAQKDGALTQEDLWGRFRLALHNGKLGLAKSIAQRIPDFDRQHFKMLDVADQSPSILLGGAAKTVKPSRKKLTAVTLNLNKREGVELYLFALDRMARTEMPVVIEKLGQKSSVSKLSDTDLAYAWGRVAYHAARMHHPKALTFYALAKNTVLDQEQLAWKVRAALRANDWDTVLSTSDAMSMPQKQEAVWRYWRGRALLEKGRRAEANQWLAPLSKERHYYGWLAAEEIDAVMGSAEQAYKVSETEVAVVASQPAIKRALELQRLDMRWEAKSEWVWATRQFDDKQLLAAAEFAMRQQWYDIAISTADNTKQLHDYNLRYPTPYRDLIRAAALNQGVDEAWIYGLARQESRFMHHAKSGVGAAGVMQIMPATAKWAAKRMGMDGYRHDLIHDLTTNVGIGTYYMRYTLELMKGQAVMATAAYNAGPSRAKRWLASQPLEAAIYIETIPFTETRNYVQKVMANAQMYAPRLGAQLQTLKTRLGMIPASDQPEIQLADAENE